MILMIGTLMIGVPTVLAFLYFVVYEIIFLSFVGVWKHDRREFWKLALVYAWVFIAFILLIVGAALES